MNLQDVPQAIQLSLAPVFLLTGIAGLLNVMAGRLARVIDRGRWLTEVAEPRGGLAANVERELSYLDRRRYLASSAITACTLSALLVCTVIVVLFLETVFNAPLKWLIGLLFIAATIVLTLGLAFFLREVHLATMTVRLPTTRGPGPRQGAQPADS